MELTELQHSTLIQGAIEIPAAPYSSSEVIHKIASRLDIDGFEIKKICIFEDPVTANIEIESKVSDPPKGLRRMLSKDTYYHQASEKFHVRLTLTKFTRSTKRMELTYSIKRLENNKFRRDDSSAMLVARGIKKKLISNFQWTTNANLTALPLSRA